MGTLMQLNSVRKTLSNVTDKIDLDDLSDLTDKLGSGLTERKKVLGLPVGSKQTDWSKVARYGAAAVAAVAGSRMLFGGKNGDDDGGDEDGGERGGPVEAVAAKGEELSEKGSDLLEQGKDAVGSVTDITDKVEDVQDAVSEASTPMGKAMAAAKAISGDDGPLLKQRLIIQEQIDIAVPRRIVYDQWTQFEDLDDRSHAVQNVTQEDDETTSWQGKMLFFTRNWDAEIVQQVPDRRIVWESSGDVDHRGVVTFHELAEDLTRVQIEMEYHPTGVVEKIGNLFLTVRHRVRKDLRLFRHHLELEGDATGAWRGQIGDDIEVPEGDQDDAAPAASSDDEDGTAEDAGGSGAKEKVAEAFHGTGEDEGHASDDEDDREE
jgi:uncharacterized membrane protein